MDDLDERELRRWAIAWGVLAFVMWAWVLWWIL